MNFLLKLVKAVVLPECFMNFDNFYLLTHKVPGVHIWWKVISICCGLKIKSWDFSNNQSINKFYKTFVIASRTLSGQFVFG
jgi:hypothetical protein